MTYIKPDKLSREESIKRNAQNFLIAQIRSTGIISVKTDITDAIEAAALLHDMTVPDSMWLAKVNS